MKPWGVAAVLFLSACSGPTPTAAIKKDAAPPAPVYFSVDPKTAAAIRGKVDFNGPRPRAQVLRIELTVFNDLYEQHRHWLKEDTLIVVEGKVTKSMYDESESLRISAEKIYDLQKAREQFARALMITCNGQSSGAKLRELLTPHLKGPCPVAIEYHNQTGRCEISLGEDWKVYPRDELIASLGEWVKPENVRLVYSSG